MKYIYYPGCCCAMKTTAKSYQESLQLVIDRLQISYEELEDWNCCGATAYMSIDESKAVALAARNLALAEKQGKGTAEQPAQMLTPCSACYMVQLKAQHYIKEFSDLGGKVTKALQTADLNYQGHVKIRHPLDVIINDIGLEQVASLVTTPLKGLRIACYYGCLMARPYSEFDDQHNPMALDKLMEALGAEVIDWPLKTRCCGGSMTGTLEEVGLRLNHIILKEAKRRGADLIVTACPFCQFNLECFQEKMLKVFKEDTRLPVGFFSQLMGLAFGMTPRQVGVQRLFRPLPTLPVAQGGAHVRA
jgi:heterodisulfide reductase subunit B2